MTGFSRSLATALAICLVLPAAALAGTSSPAIRIGQPLRGQGPGDPLCPGIEYSFTAAYFYGDGAHVVGTVAFAGATFLSCTVQAPTTGTCHVAPDGSTISFDLTEATGTAAMVAGLFEIPIGSPLDGTITATSTLTSPEQTTIVDTFEYACDVIPAANRPGLLVLALALAAVGVAVLLRRTAA